MSLRQINAYELCHRLADGWTAEHAEAPREFIRRLRDCWKANTERESAHASAYRAVLEINHVRLQGAAEMACLVLGGGADVSSEMTSFWDQLGGAGRLGVVFAPLNSLIESARTTATTDYCVFIGNDQFENLLGQSRSLETLKRELRLQIPCRRLIPYNVTRPVAPNMFFGRRDLLEKLRAEGETSFAVAGPGRIGKSSLLRQYAYELRRNLRDDRRDRVHLFNCYPFGDLRPDDLARRIALTLSADAEANRTNQNTLHRLLGRLSHNGRKPLELLFDEVDTVCSNPGFQKLTEAVKDGYCRVILCGKGALHRMIRENDTPLAERLELIQPDPLDVESAESLLFQPLADLGFSVKGANQLRDGVFELTRRLPQLVQACAKELAELALIENTDTITPGHLIPVREKFGVLVFGRLPLRDMEDDTTRLIALLLLRSNEPKMNAGRAVALAREVGVAINAEEALDVCYDLWICNFLTLEHGQFYLVNPALLEFVQHMNFLEQEISRLTESVLQNNHISATR